MYLSVIQMPVQLLPIAKDMSELAIKPANAPYCTPFKVTNKSFLPLFLLLTEGL